MGKKETAVSHLGTSQKEHRLNQETLTEEEICSGTWKEVYLFIYYKVGNREEAEDITQETYARALDFLQRESVIIDNYSNFLKTVAINILRDQWRQKQHRGTQLDIDEVNTEELLDDITIVQNTGEAAIAEITGAAAPAGRVYLKRLIRQDSTGIWTVAGYDSIMK